MKGLESPVLQGFWRLADAVRLLSILASEEQNQSFLLLHVRLVLRQQGCDSSKSPQAAGMVEVIAVSSPICPVTTTVRA